jgi:hypothetical protein
VLTQVRQERLAVAHAPAQLHEDERWKGTHVCKPIVVLANLLD